MNYDFQAAGEFIILRRRNVEIQARRKAVETRRPLGPNPHTGLTSCVSVNSAVAVLAARHCITYQPEHGRELDVQNLQLRVDGRRASLDEGGINLPSGGRIIPTGAPGGIGIEVPGGGVVIITPGWWAHQKLWHMNVSARHVRVTEGIMGEIPEGSWLPRLPDGTSLGPRPESLHDRYRYVYEKFGNAWRVNDDTSLFDYAPGKAYYWKVVAEDGQGGTVHSEMRRFETEEAE